LAGVLATGEVITCYYKADRGTWTSLGTLDYLVDGAISDKSFKKDIKTKELEIKLAFVFSGSTAVKVDYIMVLFNVEPAI